MVKQCPRGTETAEMSPYRAQNCQRLLLHFQKRLQFLHSLIVPSSAELIGHLKYHRIQNRLRYRVDIALLISSAPE